MVDFDDFFASVHHALHDGFDWDGAHFANVSDGFDGVLCSKKCKDKF